MMSKIFSSVNLNVVYWDPVQIQENVYLGPDRSEKDVLFGPETLKCHLG